MEIAEHRQLFYAWSFILRIRFRKILILSF